MALSFGDNFIDISSILEDIKYHGNMHINHEFFWESLAPLSENGGALKPALDSDLMREIEKGFGSFDSFKFNLSKTVKSNHDKNVGWLVYNKETDNLDIRITKNHELLAD